MECENIVTVQSRLGWIIIWVHSASIGCVLRILAVSSDLNIDLDEYIRDGYSPVLQVLDCS